MSKYSELLTDPRWQKMRLQILERDSFLCVSCGSGEKTLHVHHTFYEKGKAPWEYPSESLLSLCQNCHQIRAEYERTIALAIASIKSNEDLQMVAINLTSATHEQDLAEVICFGTYQRSKCAERERKMDIERFDMWHTGAS